MGKIFIVLVLVIVIAVTYFSKDKSITNSCYIWNTEAGDSASLKLRISEKSKIDGIFNFSPAEKDKKIGSVEGKLIGETADLLWHASGEGQNFNEELFIKLTGNIAQPGFGEMEEREGIYKYANRGAITYPISLQKTDCSDEALK